MIDYYHFYSLISPIMTFNKEAIAEIAQSLSMTWEQAEAYAEEKFYEDTELRADSVMQEELVLA